MTTSIEKTLITGTGRCGTTLLIKLFSFLNFDTGFNKENYKSFISNKCNSGMERHYTENYSILKNPKFIVNIEHILNDKKNISIKNVIIPIREYKLSAASRKKNGDYADGGLWCANNVQEQIIFYNKIMANYNYFMTKYDINTIFINFDKMINDKLYLFNKLKCLFDEKNITFELFSDTYDEVTGTSKPSKI